MKLVFKIIQLPAAPILVALLLRALAIPTALDGTDGVNFALALERFDLGLHQPHFPGYPLYVAAARVAAPFVAAPIALALPNLLATVALVVALRRLGRRLGGEPAGRLAAWLAAVAWPLVDVAVTPGADGTALGLMALGLAVLPAPPPLADPAALATARRGFLLAGALVGLALGARPSALPLAAPFVVVLLLGRPGRHGLLLVGGAAAAAVALWLLPFALLVGPRPLVTVAVDHVHGHFTRWGGTVGSSSLALAGRALAFAVAAGSGLAIPVLVALRGLPSTRRAAAAVALLIAPYGLWIWLAQNPDHPRHAAPLAVALALVAATAIAAQRRAPLLAPAAVVGALLFTAAGLATRPPPWRADAAGWIAAHLGGERVVVAGIHLPRVAAYYRPELRLARAGDGAELAALSRRLGPEVTVVASSEIPGLEGADLELRPLASFGAARLYAARPPLHARVEAP